MAMSHFFTFDNKYYCQLDGVAMGSPLGPTLANVFLCHFEKHWLSDCLQDFCPNIYRRYVDNIYVTFNSHEQLKKFVEYMDTKHPDIKFTFKHEHNNTFRCENNKLKTSVIENPLLVEFSLISKVFYPYFTTLV